MSSKMRGLERVRREREVVEESRRWRWWDLGLGREREEVCSGGGGGFGGKWWRRSGWFWGWIMVDMD